MPPGSEAAARTPEVAPVPVVLVSMPWTTLRAPSIQIGTVKAILDRAGVTSRTAHLYVDFFDFVRSRFGDRWADVDEFEQVGWILGEWMFAVPPFRTPSELSDERFRLEFTHQFGAEVIDQAFAIRRVVPEFLDQSASVILTGNPAVVGFSTTFAQTVPSLALAKYLKQRSPKIKVVVGGSNCEGPMGVAMHRLFPWVDIVVRGEAEQIVPQLFSELVARVPVSAQPGLCIRDGGRSTVVSESWPRVSMQEVPLPAYEDYFSRLRHSALGSSRIWLPYETSRGCWWGVKHLCTFCAANGQSVSFRSKPAEKVIQELAELPTRYGRDDIWFVDNILDERYLRTVFPVLAGSCQHRSIFVETKAHMTRKNIELLRAAGVVMAQIGVESLSTSILKLMDKGTTTIQNIRILKWSAEVGIKAFWNLIYGFPGESPLEYQRMADLIPSLVHLEPPNPPVRLRLDRFSPYHNDPASYGIEVAGPLPVNRYVYAGNPEDVLDLQYFFSFRYVDARDPDSYVRPLVEACAIWRRDRKQNFASLCVERIGDETRIVDGRSIAGARRIYPLTPIEAAIYWACDAGTTVRRLSELLPDAAHGGLDADSIRAFLTRLVAQRVMYEEDGTYLSLALWPDRTRSSPPARAAAAVDEPLDSLTDARQPRQRAELRLV